MLGTRLSERLFSVLVGHRRLLWTLALSAGLSWPLSVWPQGAAPAAGAASAPVVRFAPERDYGPFVYLDTSGEPAGLSVDLLRLLQVRSGLKVQTLPARPLQEQLNLLREGQVDLLSSLRPTPERSRYLRFTQPYVSVPAVLMVRRPDVSAGGSALSSPLTRFDGRPVAVGKGYAVESFVRETHPGVRWQAVTDDVAALNGVARGLFDAAVVDAASAIFVMREHRLTGLVSAGEVGFTYQLSFAVPLDRPDLQQWLDQAISALPSRERQAVVSRWLLPLDETELESRVPSVIGWALALLAVGVTVGVGLWWRSRTRALVP